MKRDEILKMEAGREMDALIAEKVMDWKNIHKTTEYEDPDTIHMTGEMNPFIVGNVAWVDWEVEIFPFSTSLLDAWMVVEKLRSKYLISVRSDFNHYGCAIRLLGLDDLVAVTYGDTAPLAICRAALLAAMKASEK